jgi:hypothetical protein
VTVHFLHIGKTGGSAIKDALRRERLAYWNPKNAHRYPETPLGGIHLHHHSFRMAHLPPGDLVFFFLRDPVARFVSGFESRRTKGRPRYDYEWSPEERVAFEAFPTAQRLAVALAGPDSDERRKAVAAMRTIRHLGFMQRQVGRPRQLRERLGQVLHIGRQETLAVDWEQIKARLELPADLELPTDPVRAHKREEGTAPAGALDEEAVRALRDWYARDYRLLDYCEQVRAARGWGGVEPPGRLRALRARLAVARPPG